MNQNLAYFKQAELALAAYGHYATTVPTEQELEDAGFSTTQARDSFIPTYRVVNQYNDATGLSVTVFKHADDPNNSQSFLAIRGTDDSVDLVTNLINIGLLGSTSLQPQYVSLKTKVTEWLEDGTLSSTFTVTGHSLGGFLATGLTTDPDFANNVSHTYLFNSPGVGGYSGNLVSLVLDALGINIAISDSSKISNIKAEAGSSAIADFGFQISPKIDIIVEDQSAPDVNNPPAALNHSMQVLTDALAVHSLYSQLAPTADQEQINALVDASGPSIITSAPSNHQTLESALDALRVILLNPADGKVALDEDKQTSINREELYKNLLESQKHIDSNNFSNTVQLTSLSGMSTSDIITMIERDDAMGLAARYSLIALNPFVLEGVDYSAFNTGNELERFNFDTGTGSLTSKYLVDRISFLERKIWFSTEDKNPLNSNPDNPDSHPFLSKNDFYEDVVSGYKISQVDLSDNPAHYFFGGNEADNPFSSVTEDHLYGGGGDDILKGGEGNDYLEGGTGSDTYIINPGDGTDTVFDTDGVGVIQFGAIVAEGKDGVVNGSDWIKIGNSWIDQQNGLTYLLIDQSNGTKDLRINSESGSGVRIKVWSDGKLGITLGENTLPDMPVFDRTILGDLQPEDPPEIDELGNVVVGEDAEPDRNDTLFGSAGNDLIRSLGGDDIAEGKTGEDRIEGGSGQDELRGGVGDDIVLGGTDNDIIIGNKDDDRLYAETGYSIDEAYTLGKTQTANGQKGDLLDGGVGADTLIGEAGKDILMGGLGKDIIMGLGGDDTIEGDRNLVSANHNWNVTRSVNSEGNITIYNRDYNFNVASIADTDGDDDVIYGGAGNDWVFTQGGNDFVDAGADNDVVFGSAGNDTILGQDGNDILNGDSALLDASQHGNDYLSGGNGNDELRGDGGSDYLDGGAGFDTLNGGLGNDTLDGGFGNDKLFGGDGNDTLNGGAGIDLLDGGAGNDTYVDVSVEDDVIDLEGRSTIIYADAGGISTNASSSKAKWSNEGIPTLSIVLDNDTTLDLKGALYGMDANIQFAGGNAIDLESWVSENLLDSVQLDMESVATSSGQAITQAYGGGGADFIQGSFNNDTIKGQGGNDYLSSKAGDDLLVGGSGNDTLLGGDGVDTLQGGLGADQYIGGGGADIYVFNLGDGNDIITSASAEDAGGDEVHLGAGITASKLRFFQLSDGNLLMRIGETQDSILFEDWFTAGANITALRLDDNTLIGASEMSALASNVYGGTVGDDVLMGTIADDRIEGYAGNDSLDGGAGNDTLVGGDGNDTYLFGLGSAGNDVAVEFSAGESTIALTNGTTLADLRYAQTENDLILTARSSGATLTLQDYYVSPHNWAITDAINSAIAVTDWLALPQPVINIIQLQNDFLDSVRAKWASDLLRSTNRQYERVDEVTFHAQTVTALETETSIQNFVEVDNISDAANIQRQSDNRDTSFTRVNIYSDTQVIDGTEGDYFYSLDSLFLIPPGPSQGIENWKAVLDSKGELAGFIVHVSTPPRTVTENHYQTTYITNTKVERIEGGDSDNVIEGYKNNRFSNEISMIDGGGGNDTLYAPGYPGLSDEEPFFTDTDIFIGGFSYGNAGNDIIYGGYYRDTLAGGDGSDFLDGGFSQDTYVILSGELGVDTIWDTGTQLEQWWDLGLQTINSYSIQEQKPIAQDTLHILEINQEDLALSWGQQVVNGVRDSSNESALYTQTMHATLTLSWTGGGVEIVLPNSTDLPGMGLELIQFGDGVVLTMDELIALAGPSTILNPQELDNIIVGQDTNDVIYGEGGNDTLDGGSGNDVLNGGMGDDILIGSDGNDTLTGGDGADRLDGGMGDEFLNGGTGNDILTGGTGNDTYFFNRGSGQDTINSYDTTIGKIDTVEFHYRITPDEIHAGRSGNDLVLSIIGTSDTLTIQNYLDNDGITPYSVEQIEVGSDTWDLATIQTKLNSNRAPELSVALSDQEATEGSAFSYTMDANTFIDLDASDMLTYSAKLEDDSPLPAWLSFDADTLIFSGIPDISGVLSIRVTAKDSGNLTASDVFDIDISNQGLALNGTSSSDMLDGGAGNDTLRGFASNDILNGNLGNDLLNGGAGNDTMSGGAGDDIYVVNSVQDIVIENLDEGIDTIRSSLSYAIGANVENLKLTGTKTTDGTGNALNNKLIGNNANNLLTGKAGNDRLVGKEGADMMVGGMGNDIYVVDNVGDTVTELSDEGIDKVRSSISYTLNSNVENLVLTDVAAINGTGNSLDNNLVGNNANNTLTGELGNDRLNGREGADTLIGGMGDDIYVVDNVADIVTELVDEGIDKVRSSISYTLRDLCKTQFQK